MYNPGDRYHVKQDSVHGIGPSIRISHDKVYESGSTILRPIDQIGGHTGPPPDPPPFGSIAGPGDMRRWLDQE